MPSVNKLDLHQGYLDMESWEMALKAEWEDGTFNYDGTIWQDGTKTTFGTGAAYQNTKTEAFSQLKVKRVKLVMDNFAAIFYLPVSWQLQFLVFNPFCLILFQCIHELKVMWTLEKGNRWKPPATCFRLPGRCEVPLHLTGIGLCTRLCSVPCSSVTARPCQASQRPVSHGKCTVVV